MRILIILYITLYCSLAVSHAGDPNGTGTSDPYTNINKACLFHEEPYELHESIQAPCSFRVPGHLPKTHINSNGRHVPHDPECFDEVLRYID